MAAGGIRVTIFGFCKDKVCTAKNRSLDAALCVYRDAPLQNGYSSAQLSFGRSLNLMGFYSDKRIDLKRYMSTDQDYKEKMELN